MLKYAILGLLVNTSRHGYDLKQAFETLSGGTWPLNIGQIYTTLARLERDGLVECHLVEQDLLPDRKTYTLTPAGRAELDGWLAETAGEGIRLKNEFFIKLMIHQLVSTENPSGLIQQQRLVYMQTLAQLVALASDSTLESVTRLLIEGAILHVKADLEWLNLCEERM